METIAKFDLVRNRNKFKKQLLLYTSRKTVSCIKTKNSIVLLIEKLPYTIARELGKACGKLISTKFVLEDIVQLKTRNLYKAIENQPLWDSRVNLKYYEKAIKELTFWKNNINFFFNKKPLRAYDLPRTVIFSDASSFAIGAIWRMSH